MAPSTGRVVRHPVIAPQAWCGFVHVVSDGADAIEERMHGLFLVKRQGAGGAAGTLSWSSRMGCSRGSGGGSIARRRLSVTIALTYAGRTGTRLCAWTGRYPDEHDTVSVAHVEAGLLCCVAPPRPE